MIDYGLVIKSFMCKKPPSGPCFVTGMGQFGEGGKRVFLDVDGCCTNSSTSPALNLIFPWCWGRLRGAVLLVKTEMTHCSLGPCTGNSDPELCWLPRQQRAAGWRQACPEDQESSGTAPGTWQDKLMERIRPVWCSDALGECAVKRALCKAARAELSFSRNIE